MATILRPAPGQRVQITDDYLERDPTWTLLGRVVTVIQPGEYEEPGEITIVFDGEEYYVPADCVVIVPA